MSSVTHRYTSDDIPRRPAGLRGRLYHLFWRWAKILHSASNACLHTASGLMNRDDLRDASRFVWQEFRSSDAEVDAGLEAWEKTLYARVLRSGDRVLLVGCGAGRDLIGLLALGHNVTGVDATPELIELARGHLRRRGVNAPLILGSVEALEISGTFDVAVFSYGSFSYLLGSSARVATLARLKDVLARDGRILISYIAHSRQSRAATMLSRGMARLAGVDWRPEPGDAFSHVVFGSRVISHEHRFQEGEVERECEMAGLRVVEVATGGVYPHVVARPADQRDGSFGAASAPGGSLKGSIGMRS